jgi:CHAT domain-containing protein
MDPRRAEFRSAQRAVYNRALATIVRHANHPASARAFAEWSERRKGRAFESGAARAPRAGEPAAPRAGAAVLDYVVLDSLVAAQVVSSGRSRIVTLPVSPQQLRAQVVDLRAALDVRVGSELDVKRARFPATTAYELYRSLFAPLEPLLTGVTELTVVPDGILHLVPFDALVSAPPGNDRDEASIAYLIDRYTIGAAVTAAAPASPIRFSGGRVLAVAPLLPANGREEIDVIRRSVESRRVRVLAGAAATRTALRSAVRGADMIHFAAHAVANAHEPEASYIELAPDASGDHALRAADIDAIPLSGQVIVLSACETARGRVLEGEGVLSLSRSFLRAGARATVATLWPVGPQAAEFAGELYARATVGAEVAAALREAKLAMRRAGSPAFAWAPFQLYVGPQAPQDRLTVATRNEH